MDYKTFMLITLFVLLLVKLIVDAVGRRKEKRAMLPSEKLIIELQRFRNWKPGDGPAVLYELDDLVERTLNSEESVSYYDMTLLIAVLTMENKPWSNPKSAYRILKILSENGDESKADPYWVYLFGVFTKEETDGFPYDPVLGDYLMKVSERKIGEVLDKIKQED